MLVFLCALNNLTLCVLPSRWFYTHFCQGFSKHPWRVDSGENTANVDIAVLTIADDRMPVELTQRIAENRYNYCWARKYSCVLPNVLETKELAGQLPMAWAKLILLREVYRKHDCVFVLDADSIIMQNEIDLSIPCRQLYQNGQSLMISSDVNNINSGVFMVRNTSWTGAFLDVALVYEPLLSKPRYTIPLKYENRAFFFLTGMWPQCYGVSRPDTWFAPRFHNVSWFSRGVMLVDRCLINTRPRVQTMLGDPLRSDITFDNIAGAFVVHGAGGTAFTKYTAMCRLMRDVGLGC